MTTEQDLLLSLNWDHLRRHQVFTRGILNVDEEYLEGGKKKELRKFDDLPSFSAVKISQASNLEEKKVPINPSEE